MRKLLSFLPLLFCFVFGEAQQAQIPSNPITTQNSITVRYSTGNTNGSYLRVDSLFQDTTLVATNMVDTTGSVVDTTIYRNLSQATQYFIKVCAVDTVNGGIVCDTQTVMTDTAGITASMQQVALGPDTAGLRFIIDVNGLPANVYFDYDLNGWPFQYQIQFAVQGYLDTTIVLTGLVFDTVYFAEVYADAYTIGAYHLFPTNFITTSPNASTVIVSTGNPTTTSFEAICTVGLGTGVNNTNLTFEYRPQGGGSYVQIPYGVVTSGSYTVTIPNLNPGTAYECRCHIDVPMPNGTYSSVVTQSTDGLSPLTLNLSVQNLGYYAFKRTITGDAGGVPVNVYIQDSTQHVGYLVDDIEFVGNFTGPFTVVDTIDSLPNGLPGISALYNHKALACDTGYNRFLTRSVVEGLTPAGNFFLWINSQSVIISGTDLTHGCDWDAQGQGPAWVVRDIYNVNPQLNVKDTIFISGYGSGTETFFDANFLINGDTAMVMYAIPQEGASSDLAGGASYFYSNWVSLPGTYTTTELQDSTVVGRELIHYTGIKFYSMSGQLVYRRGIDEGFDLGRGHLEEMLDQMSLALGQYIAMGVTAQGDVKLANIFKR